MTEPARPRLSERKLSFAKDAVLDAAEQLLQENPSADFSMRTLCERAGVSFATPFNYFGSKGGILRGLAERLFERAEDRCLELAPTGDAIDRIVASVDIGADVILENSAVHRTICAGLLAGGDPDSDRDFFAPAVKLWKTTLGEFDGFEKSLLPVARALLAEQLATQFRGILSLWLAYEIPDERFKPMVRTGVALLLLSLVRRERRETLLTLLQTETPENDTIEEAAPRNTRKARSR